MGFLSDVMNFISPVTNAISQAGRFVGEPVGWLGDVIQAPLGENPVSSFLKNPMIKTIAGTTALTLGAGAGYDAYAGYQTAEDLAQQTALEDFYGAGAGADYGDASYITNVRGDQALVYGSPEFYKAGAEAGLTRAQAASLFDTTLGGQSAYDMYLKDKLLNTATNMANRTGINYAINKGVGLLGPALFGDYKTFTPQQAPNMITNYGANLNTPKTLAPLPVAPSGMLDQTGWPITTPNLATPMALSMKSDEEKKKKIEEMLKYKLLSPLQEQAVSNYLA